MAANEARLDLERWDAGGYSRAFMAKVIMFHRLRGAIDQHRNDAQATFIESQRKGK